MTLSELPVWFVRAFALAFGLVWGSFLNVVIYRVPLGLSVVRPGSRCPACKTPISGALNVPIVGFLVLRGRAACCGAKMSWRYPLVEAIGGALSLAIVERTVFTMPPTTSLLHAGAVYVAGLALVLGLTAAAFIDLDHMILPDTVTLGGTVLGVATASLRSMSFVDALIGAAAGFLVIWLPFVVIYPMIRGRVGMGLGDAKLVMLAGAWFGWAAALFVLGAGAVQGTIATMATLLVRGRIEDPEAVRAEREEVLAELAAMTPEERAEAEKELAGDPIFQEGGGVAQARVPFGPFLILATIEWLLFGGELSGLLLGDSAS